MLKPVDAETVRDLLPFLGGPHLVLLRDSILAGNSPRLFVAADSRVRKAGVIWDKAHCLYVVGAVPNNDGLEALRDLIDRAIIDEMSARQIRFFKVYYSDAQWKPCICLLLPGARLDDKPRSLYVNDHSRKSMLAPAEAPVAAPGIRVTRIDSDLLRQRRLANVGVVIEEIESCWSSVDRFLEHGFGFVAQTEKEMACFCTAEYVSEGKSGTGIATIRGFERKGLATMAATAFVEHARSRGITLFWESWTDNLASIRVAEKVGFALHHEYEVFLAEIAAL